MSAIQQTSACYHCPKTGSTLKNITDHVLILDFGRKSELLMMDYNCCTHHQLITCLLMDIPWSFILVVHNSTSLVSHTLDFEIL
jgi:hypothetical protein